MDSLPERAMVRLPGAGRRLAEVKEGGGWEGGMSRLTLCNDDADRHLTKAR